MRKVFLVEEEQNETNLKEERLLGTERKLQILVEIIEVVVDPETAQS